jgi:hypothetical protein
MSSGVVSDIRLVLAKVQEDTIAAQVCERDEWRAASFVEAMRGLRHLQQLIGELDREEAAAAGERDLGVLRRAADSRPKAAE